MPYKSKPGDTWPPGYAVAVCHSLLECNEDLITATLEAGLLVLNFLLQLRSWKLEVHAGRRGKNFMQKILIAIFIENQYVLFSIFAISVNHAQDCDVLFAVSNKDYVRTRDI